MKENILYLTRFCGVEKYPLKAATWSIIEGDGTWDDPDMLCLEMVFDKGNDLHEDTAYLEAEPLWKLNFYEREIAVDLLQSGFSLEQPNEDKDVDGNLYYTEHQPTINNKMEIIAVDGKRLKIQLVGYTEDVNYCDGSKPQNTMQLIGWFTRE